MPIISLPVFASEPPKLLLTGTPVLGLFSELLWLGVGGAVGSHQVSPTVHIRFFLQLGTERV